MKGIKIKELQECIKKENAEIRRIQNLADAKDYIRRHPTRQTLGADLVWRGEELISAGHYEDGIALLFEAVRMPEEQLLSADTTTLFLRLAEYYLERGQGSLSLQKGRQYLEWVCTKGPSNYESSIAQSGLTEIWKKYKHLVEEEVPPSSEKGITKISKSITEIRALSGQERLNELGQHVYEMSHCGSNLSLLNRWERILFDLTTLAWEHGSSGLAGYFCGYSRRYQQTKKALETVGIPVYLDILAKAENDFPGGMPKSQEAIENAVLKYELEFEEAEQEFFDRDGETEWAKRMETWTAENIEHFR